jgi:hypothetical protein
MKIIASDIEPGFEFQRAWIAEGPQPRALMGGIECVIETKPGMLADGVAFCEPVDPEVAINWPLSVIVEKSRPDGSTYPTTLSNATDRPEVVRAARNFAALEAAGAVVVGMEL